MWEKYFQIHKFVQQKPAPDKNIKNVPNYLKDIHMIKLVIKTKCKNASRYCEKVKIDLI